jgi:hypothetical protein
VKIIVIATGFDETRARLAQMMPRPKILQPEGIVSEIPEEKPPVEEKKEEFPEEEYEEFDIPAFLRQGK